VILSTSGIFDVDLALPEAPEKALVPRPLDSDRQRVLSMEELLKLERENFERALSQAGGKVSGPDGAAARLGINPSTLNSRLRALGLRSKIG
jgi:transcriptional regulator with GAF, ATPase, and Fis domain